MGAISFFNRYTGQIETEKVYGGNFVEAAYGNPDGSAQPASPFLPFLVDKIFSSHTFSRFYGALQSSTLSHHKIDGFVKEFQIPMAQYESGPFASFNDFFIRKFKTGQRPFSNSPNDMSAFAEARYLGFASVSDSTSFPVKGAHLNPQKILSSNAHSVDAKLISKFADSPALIARLCPVDYHRFHFPDSGETLQQVKLGGKLHSVNPTALKAKADIFFTNERQVSILQTEHFGLLAYVEIGALAVGKIVQSHTAKNFKRGDEKGYFLFGGSTVIVFGEKGRWTPSRDILEHTRRGIETYVHLGDAIGLKAESKI